MLENARVLIVEDQPMILLMIEALLTEFGCKRIQGVTDTAQVSVADEDGRFAAAILDVQLREGTSLNLAGHLAKKGIPIIFVSGGSARELPEQFRMVPFLEKPFNPAELRETLIQAVAA